ncbi:MAG: hypothetical protein AAF639_03120 [Chloroflexota bacterium]
MRTRLNDFWKKFNLRGKSHQTKTKQKSRLISKLATIPLQASISNSYNHFQDVYTHPLLDNIYLQAESLIHTSLKIEIDPTQIEGRSLSPDRPSEISLEEQQLNRDLTASLLVFAINSIFAITYPPLLWLSFPFTVKNMSVYMEWTAVEFKDTHKVGFLGLSVLGYTWLFIRQRWWILSLIDTIYFANEKFLLKTRGTSHWQGRVGMKEQNKGNEK